VINAARDVTKSITYRLETYTSRDLGVLGYVDEDRVTFYRLPLKQHTKATPFDIARVEKLPRVEVIYSSVDADGALIDAAVTHANAEGLVIAGFPTGSATPEMEKAMNRAAARGIAVVMSNRGGTGRITDTRTKEARPIIFADNLTPQKARVLLMLALTTTKDRAEIQRIFQRY
jgi:L-asparaginase